MLVPIQIDSFITYSNCENWCVFWPVPAKYRVHERERQWQEIAPSTSFPHPINTVEIAYQNEEKQQGATGCTSLPAWNLWKPFTHCPSEENSDGFYTLKFERWYTVASMLSGPRYGSVQFMFSRGIMCKLSGTFNVQQTIYSVCAFSCWICCPLIRCMSV